MGLVPACVTAILVQVLNT